MPTYARMQISFSHGQGSWLFDDQGRRYLDAISGIAVCNLGHAHPEVRDAIADQAGKLIHTSNLYQIKLQETLASRLRTISGLDSVFFCNSGAEANEAALKLARKYGHDRGVERPKVIVMENSFHGRTLFTLSATGNPKVQEGFEPLVDTFIRVPFDDLKSVESLEDPDIVAILLEPVQGEGGVRIPSKGYLTGIRNLANSRGWLMMLDEVQCGMGRTGRWFAFQHEDLMPDVMTLAKALGNGVPIGACLTRNAASHVLTAGKHGSTFGGNPLACRAAIAVLDTMDREQLVDAAEQSGSALIDMLKNALEGNPGVIDIRGIGLMIGIELDRPCAQLVGKALEQGLLINVTADRVIRLLPPMILNQEERDYLANKLIQLILEFTEDCRTSCGR